MFLELIDEWLNNFLEELLRENSFNEIDLEKFRFVDEVSEIDELTLKITWKRISLQEECDRGMVEFLGGLEREALEKAKKYSTQFKGIKLRKENEDGEICVDS